MAHIQRRERTRKDGRVRIEWLAVYRTPSGTRRMRAFPLERDAKAHLEDVTGRRSRGELVEDEKGGRETLGAFYDRWRLAAEARDRPSASTRAKYAGVWRTHVAEQLAGRRLDEITRLEVRDLVLDVEKGSAYQALEVLKLVRMLLNQAVDAELVARNVAAQIRAPRVQRREPEVLSPAEVNAIVEKAGEEWRALIYLGAYCSLRWSEIVALKLQRVDFLRRQLRVEEKAVEAAGRLSWGAPKTAKSRRSVAMPSIVAEALAEHVRQWPPRADGLLFTAERGGALRRPHFMADVWRPAVKAAKLPGFRFLNLRHTGNTLALAAGGRAEDVADRLGHTSTRMTLETYRTRLVGRDREVADRLDELIRDPEASARLKPPELAQG